MHIAIVGSGVAGMTCAHLLGDEHETVLFEADDRLGGHVNTVDVVDPEAGPLAIDTGFIVHNDRNYPNLVRLFVELGIPTIDTEMSFAVTDRATGFSYRATNLNTLFAKRSNLLDRRMWRLLADVARFYRKANQYLRSGRDDLTLTEFLNHNRFSPSFIDLHLIPMGAAVWSADPGSFGDVPAATLFGFLSNHGLLGVGSRPQWRTVAGGARTYVEAIAERFSGTIHLGTPVLGITRADPDDDGVGATVRTAGGEQRFDRVILACHSDQSLDLLDDPTPTEKEVLGAIRYQPNRATLHTDLTLLSPEPRAWAAWNYDCLDDGDQPATVTYDLTALQHLPGSQRYLVSLNSDERIAPDSVIAGFDYAHPVFDRSAVEAQRRLDEISGIEATHYCGAYWGHGFHEDGISSALRVCADLGVDW